MKYRPIYKRLGYSLYMYTKNHRNTFSYIGNLAKSQTP